MYVQTNLRSQRDRMHRMLVVGAKARKSFILKHEPAADGVFSEAASDRVGGLLKYFESSSADGLAVEDRYLLVALGAKVSAANAERAHRTTLEALAVKADRSSVYLTLGKCRFDTALL